ncbi:YqaA family protein [Marinobacteraceae bacterium S3BR75-40.1]
MTAYLVLFSSAFAAATILPFYSEVVFASMIYQGFDPWGLWVVATLGNTLGANVNWVIGRYLLHYQDRRWFPVKPEQLTRAQEKFQKFGSWTLLMAWLPIGGDALTFVAGIMRVNVFLFTLLVAIGKGARYAAVLWFSDWVIF